MSLAAKKYFGQHFLINNNIAIQIVENLDLNLCNNVIEIGPGQGVLTKLLVKKTPHIKLIEIDLDCVDIIKKKFKNTEIVHADFLKIDLKSIGFKKYNIIGNFPYNISSQILFKILENRNDVIEVVGMFQKEVAERICSKPNSKKYGILSVLIQAYFSCEYLIDVGSENFKPVPKVQSSVIKLTRNNTIELDCAYPDFLQVVKACFSQRRKKIKNALKNFINLNNTNLPDTLSKRAEQLDVADFIKLTINLLQKK